jgi:hypothetical protein
MGRVERPALRGTWLGRLLRLLAPVMRVVLSTPLHHLLSRWFLLLSWTGPRTGQRHTIPVSYVAEGNRVFATTGDSWWRSVVASDDVTIRLQGRSRRAEVVPVTEVDESCREHLRLCREHPWFRVLAGLPAVAGGNPDADATRQAIDAGRTLLRIEAN